MNYRAKNYYNLVKAGVRTWESISLTYRAGAYAWAVSDDYITIDQVPAEFQDEVISMLPIEV